jgi:lactate dehydrogenase-like 2-hydroxyacid dehydrogenase
MGPPAQDRAGSPRLTDPKPAPETAGAVLILTAHRDLLARFEGQRILTSEDVPAMDDAARAGVRVIVQSGVAAFTAADMDLYPNLALLVSIGAGYDGIDQGAAEARGIEIRSGVGANADDVADLAVALFLAGARQIVFNDSKIKTGGWRGRGLRPTRSIYDHKVGILGLGSIGRATADRLKPFGCPIAWTGPRPKPQIELPYVPTLLELARQSDVLIVAAPLDDATRRIVNREVIEALGPQGLLINIARGGLVDEDELIGALRDGRLGGAALDVFEEEPTPAERWRDVPNTILTPHVGGVTFGGMDKVFDRAAENVTSFLAGR